MVRLIVRTTNSNEATHVEGGTIVTIFHTFDIEHPELESYLRTPSTWENRVLIGACLPEPRKEVAA